MEWSKKLAVVMMVAIMSCFATGCNKKNGNEKAVEEYDTKEMVFEGADFAVEGMEGECDCAYVSNGSLYVSTYEWSGNTSIFRLYSVNTDGSDVKEITRLESEDGQCLQSVSVGENGAAAFLLNLVSAQNEITCYIVKTDEQGKEVLRESVYDLLNITEEEDIKEMVMDDNGRIVIAMDTAVYILSTDCKSVDKVKLDSKGYVSGVTMTRDGQIICGMSTIVKGDECTELRMLDVDKAKWGDSYESNATYLLNMESSMSSDADDYDIYYSDENGIYGYNMVDKKETKIMDYAASNIMTEDGERIVPLGKNQFIGTSYEENDTTKLIVYKKADSSINHDRMIITVGAMYLDDTIKKQAMEFNKNNKEYQIELKEYSNEEDPVAKMNADIIAGNVPDVIALNSLPYEQYIEKGMLEELTPYFEKDEEISTDDILDSVLEAMKIDDKIYYIAPDFGISTIIARTSDVGNETGWTFNELERLLEEKGDAARPFYYENKSAMLYPFLMNGLGDYINWKTGECNFNSQDFKDILELCNNKGNDKEEEYNFSEMLSLIHDKKVLFMEGKVNFEEVQLYKKVFGEEINYIGYPGNENQGSYFQFDNQLAIYSKSKVKDGAWEFIRSFMKKEYQGKIGNLQNTPTRKDCFAMKVKAITTTEEYIDELGQEVAPIDYNLMYNDLEVALKPFSQEEAEMFTNLVNSTNKVSAYDEAMMKIVQEEAKAYFAGQKSLDEAVDIIQNRITTYVNENR